MANIIRVTPEELKKTAEEMKTSASAIQKLTTQMTETVNSMTGQVWSGDAQQAYIAKFKGLEADITALTKIISDHANNMEVIATDYQNTEAANKEAAATLKAGILS